MVWKIIRRRPRIENAHLQKSPRVEISMRFRCARVSRSREKLVHTFEQNCSKLTYAFQNLKRRSRPIVSGDFCRSPSFADPPRWADKKNRSAHIGADRIQVSLLFALRIPRIVLQEWLRNRSSRPLRLLRRDIAAARSFLRSSRP